jgi:EAL domain-containing protein (putative c-di-GMP-specific phosphodiesterase class I)
VLSGAIVGVEALRWHDEVLGQVPPSRFIPVAESTGLILPLSDWVLVTACEQIAAWARQGMPLRVAVNLSAHQFRQGQLVERVREALTRAGAPAQLLEIEITESVAMMHPALAREQLDALVGLGCSVALDDFGTGYSSMAYLKALPVSAIKIDRGFIQDIPHDQSDAQISQSIIALAHGLGLSVVAEGVETEAQRQFLARHGCEVYQGWLFARAMPAEELEVLPRAPCPAAAGLTRRARAPKAAGGGAAARDPLAWGDSSWRCPRACCPICFARLPRGRPPRGHPELRGAGAEAGRGGAPGRATGLWWQDLPLLRLHAWRSLLLILALALGLVWWPTNCCWRGAAVPSASAWTRWSASSTTRFSRSPCAASPWGR